MPSVPQSPDQIHFELTNLSKIIAILVKDYILSDYYEIINCKTFLIIWVKVTVKRLCLSNWSIWILILIFINSRINIILVNEKTDRTMFELEKILYHLIITFFTFILSLFSFIFFVICCLYFNSLSIFISFIKNELWFNKRMMISISYDMYDTSLWSHWNNTKSYWLLILDETLNLVVWFWSDITIQSNKVTTKNIYLVYLNIWPYAWNFYYA
jgi:hypothetical protein